MTTRRSLFALLVLCAFGATTQAAVTISGTGLGENAEAVKAKAVFTVSGNTLTIVLSNTSVAGTQNNGSVITGVIFDLQPDLAGTLTFNPTNNPTLTSGSDVYVHHDGSGNSTRVRIDNNTALGGSYSSQLNDTSLGDFGVSTTGANSIFSADPITLGNGGADYGLVAPNTYPAGSHGDIFLTGNTGPSKETLPLVQTSVTFVFTFTGTLSEDQIVGANFLVGTNGDYFGGFREPPESEHTVPEPASMAIWGLGVIGAGTLMHRRRNRKS
jgi:hypothetical protein